MDINKDKYNLKDLNQLMARLRSPDNGCPWDIEQTFDTIKPHTIEEAYEVADAIERDNMDDLKDELGDLLFQILFHAQIATEQKAFTIEDVIDHVTKKMIFRHPHVFGDKTASDAKDVEDNIWEQQKAKEKSSNNKSNHVLDNVTTALPALLFANKVQKAVAKTGFKYPTIQDVFDKLDEEKCELQNAITSNNNDDIREEYGDLLLVSTLMGTELKLNPEEELRRATLKFMRRFNAVEDDLGNLNDKTIDEMMQSWSRVKGCN